MLNNKIRTLPDGTDPRNPALHTSRNTNRGWSHHISATVVLTCLLTTCLVQPAAAQNFVALENQDFGSGALPVSSTPGASISPATTDYTPIPTASSVGDGWYAITSNPDFNDDFGPGAADQWQHAGDHTTGSGYMALFNANPARRGEQLGTYLSYSTSVADIPGATYRVSFYAANILRFNAPAASFDAYIGMSVRDGVNGTGTLYGQIPNPRTPLPRATGDQDNLPWQFRSVDVTLPMSYNSAGLYFNFFNSAPETVTQSGNDLVIDDVLIQVATTSLEGRVYNDANENGTYDGAAENWPGTAPYIAITDNNDDVVSFTQAAPDGSYTIPQIIWSTSNIGQKVVLTNAAPTIGAPLTAASAPAGYYVSAENPPATYGSTGVAPLDGIQNVTRTDVPSNTLQNFNFGLLQNVISATNDTPPSVDSTAGGTIPNVIANDSLAGATNPAIGTEVTVNTTGTAQDGTTTLGLNTAPTAGSITLSATTGEVTVAPGTSPGTYIYTYEICETANPTNCDTATVTIVVELQPGELITVIEDDLASILEEDLANTLTVQSRQISGYSADAVDRLRGRSHDSCLADINDRARNIHFDTDKAIIKPQSEPVLDQIAELLTSCSDGSIEIAGHTDSDASDAYNIDLSQRRVLAVKQALAARGVDTSGYAARGYGEHQPIATNATEAGKAQNRRVEFRPLDVVNGNQMSCEDGSSMSRSFDAQVEDGRATANGEFMRDQHDCSSDSREVYEGALSYTDTGLGQTQSAINLSYRREKYRGSESLSGFFVGLYASQSEVTRLANGEIVGIGANAGVYGARHLRDSLFLDYYLGAAAGSHKFDLAFDRSIGTISATGDYQYLAGFAGVALSGEFELGKQSLSPRAGFDYVYTSGANVDVLAELGGSSDMETFELDAISGGRAFAELRIDRLIRGGDANLWIIPRVACHQSIGSLDGVCGYGGSFGIESAAENTDFTYAFEVDGEWGDGYSLGSATISASRQIGIGTLRGDATLDSRGNAGVAGLLTLDL